MAGDHKQLDATVKSKEAGAKGLSISLFERVKEHYGDKVSVLLNEQYRMNKLIMDWASAAMYEGQLIADASVRDRLLFDLYPSASSDLVSSPLLLLDTAGASMFESVDEENESKFNQG